MRNKLLVLASAVSLCSTPKFTTRTLSFGGEEGPADFVNPRPFGYEKPWGKRNRRKLGGMKNK